MDCKTGKIFTEEEMKGILKLLPERKNRFLSMSLLKRTYITKGLKNAIGN